ncbi:hypothetical protein [uncultured Erythrobacter sp.]|uniref:hypothetical protein n=1 Tax=uncultured Erythrobacter sp. TaxID=263913 RepID=UPI00262EF740|nr:hypothetical protein [uncultured Erythrobacter sp.]
MASGNPNMTGQWDGVYYYPDVPEAGPTTPFLATLTEDALVVKGEVIEPNEFHPGTARATVLGLRIGRSVHWEKTYHDAGEEYCATVLYFGTLSEDCDTVTGEWSIEHWGGPFEMVRASAAQEPASQSAEAELEIVAGIEL